MTASVIERNKVLSKEELVNEMRQRALIKLRAKYLHNMESGLFTQEGFVELDGFAASALDNTTKEFTHMQTLMKEDKSRCVANKHCKCSLTNWVQDYSNTVTYDMFINFIDCSKAVHVDLSQFAEHLHLEGQDKEMMVSVCSQIVEEMKEHVSEAENHLQKQFIDKFPGVAKLVAHRRACFYTLTQMRNYVGAQN